MKLTKKQVGRLYRLFCDRYFHGVQMPKWGTFEFRWKKHKGFSAVTHFRDPSGLACALHVAPRLRKHDKEFALSLLHEMVHMRGRRYWSHDDVFFVEAARIAKAAVKEFF